MTPEVFKIMLAMGVFILPMFIIILVQDFLHVKSMEKMYDRIDELQEKHYGKNDKR